MTQQSSSTSLFCNVQPLFITFEGIEGSGKGTALEYTTAWLQSVQVDFLLTREPGGSDLGSELRRFLLDIRYDVVPKAELFLYLADRAQHVEQVIRPALSQGKLVLSDRYADSTIVYQGYGRGLDINQLQQLNSIAVDGLWPDITFLLDVPAEIGLTRARARNQKQGLDVTEGKFEAEKLSFHERIRSGYLTFAAKNTDRYVILDTTQQPADVFAGIRETLSKRLALSA